MDVINAIFCSLTDWIRIERFCRRVAKLSVQIPYIENRRDTQTVRSARWSKQMFLFLISNRLSVEKYVERFSCLFPQYSPLFSNKLRYFIHCLLALFMSIYNFLFIKFLIFLCQRETKNSFYLITHECVHEEQFLWKFSSKSVHNFCPISDKNQKYNTLLSQRHSQKFKNNPYETARTNDTLHTKHSLLRTSRTKTPSLSVQRQIWTETVWGEEPRK